MPKLKANNLTMNYDQQGTESLSFSFLSCAADDACYAFQVAEHASF